VHSIALRCPLLVLTVLLGLAGASVAIACDDEEAGQAEIPVVTITAADYRFDAPASIAGGLTQITIENTGTEDHQAQLFLLNEGASYDDLQSALPQGEAAVFALGEPAGGPLAAPGEESAVIQDLQTGQYALICNIPSPDGTPHFARGMIAPLEVTEAPEEQPEPPQADTTVRLSDFTFDAPDTMEAGNAPVAVVNDGPQFHEMAVAKLNEGATVDDLTAYLNAPTDTTTPPPAPYRLIGGMDAMALEQEGWSVLNLTPGTYALVCFVPDAETGAPHFTLGMIDSFTVE
jgi:hypothetical protein